jgi:hypothetical protein
MSEKPFITSFEQLLLNFHTREQVSRGGKRSRYNLGRLKVGAAIAIAVPNVQDPRAVRRVREAAYQEGQRRERRFSVRSQPGAAVVTRVQ